MLAGTVCTVHISLPGGGGWMGQLDQADIIGKAVPVPIRMEDSGVNAQILTKPIWK